MPYFASLSSLAIVCKMRVVKFLRKESPVCSSDMTIFFDSFVVLKRFTASVTEVALIFNSAPLHAATEVLAVLMKYCLLNFSKHSSSNTSPHPSSSLAPSS
ncbi:ORF106 [White spot syndrome virus]|uniref:Wsv034 n=3 Tax=White spot syndrome virus TaxID=342409 RepID=Q8VBD1_WSSVS|nr:wsv034 [Shrimp white spot syndrome virus]AFX59411.1 wsv034 [White spot syndrome virus]AAL33038.1 wsv034 [Shrimp white spot syndrome virus]AAL88959.1 WSSV091 [Shrimp white spot syndrome virus]ATU83646.1 ORF106 [White spot syndrome virus]AWQ60224.1 wsv034 [Shrimp white spot syndrome virus]